MIKSQIASIDYWYHLIQQKIVSVNSEMVQKMVGALEREYPRLCSLIMERACNLQCAHCIFQLENTSSKISKSIGLTELACNIINQLNKDASVIHEGRILRDWHLSTFAAIRKIRPDVKIGLIDNGTYLYQKDFFRNNNVLLDWIDISFDGTREIHNLQRKNKQAFDVAMEGLQSARKFVIPGDGKVTSLFTVTNLNFQDVCNTADLLLGDALIDEFHITPFSPVRAEIESLAFCPGYKEGKVDDCKVLWEQIVKICSNYQDEKQTKVFVRVYQQSDLEKIARAVGIDKFLKAFFDLKSVRVDQGSVSFEIDGVRINYVPLSICPSETFVIDADGSYRMAYCLKYTLEELNSGLSKTGLNIQNYTVSKLTFESNFHELYKKGVYQWMDAYGFDYLVKESKMFNELKSLTQ